MGGSHAAAISQVAAGTPEPGATQGTCAPQLDCKVCSTQGSLLPSTTAENRFTVCFVSLLACMGSIHLHLLPLPGTPHPGPQCDYTPLIPCLNNADLQHSSYLPHQLSELTKH